MKLKKDVSWGWEIYKLYVNEKFYLLRWLYCNEGLGEKKEKGKKEYSESVVMYRC